MSYSQGRPGAAAGGAAQAISLAAPIIGLLGIVGFFFGFGRYLSVQGLESFMDYADDLDGELVVATQSFFEADATLFPALMLLGGLIALVGWVLRAQLATALSTAIAVTVVLTMLTNLQGFGDFYSTGWGYWIVFVIALLQVVFGVLALAPVIATQGRILDQRR